MVKIDRGFIGVLLIAVVISTVFMGFITVEKADKGIEIIKNKYPAMIRTSVQERHTFVTNVIARKDYEEVKLVFSVLRIMEPVFGDENITTAGIELTALPVGTGLLVGDEVVLEVSQIGKECHAACAVRRQVGSCIMPEEGVFARVVRGGVVKPDDRLEIIMNG